MGKVLAIILILIALISTGFFLKQYMAPVSVKLPEVKLDVAPTEEPTDLGRYANLTKSKYDDSRGKKRVLFFHATWCPDCKAADAQFTKREGEIPEDVVVFKVDYDSRSDLKKKYGIVYQHTFVLVDDEDKEVQKWNGGAIDELINNT